MRAMTIAHRKGLCRRRRRKTMERKRTNWREVMCGIIAGLVIAGMIFLPPAEQETTGQVPKAAETTTPYYMTEEYQEMKRQERLEAQKEAEAMRKSIEEYNARMEKQAEKEFEQIQEEMQKVETKVAAKTSAKVEKEEKLPDVFYTMSADWEEEDIEGFKFYTIPEEYSREGGLLPERVQIYIWCLCKQRGLDFTTTIAQIELESAYQYDAVGKAKDSGYMQVVGRYNEDTMEELGVTDLLNPYQNINVGTKRMEELLKKYDGNYAKALTAYQYGESGAYKHFFSAGVDANPYAKLVLKKAKRIRKELEQE